MFASGTVFHGRRAQSGPAAGHDFPSAQPVRHSSQRDIVQFEETDSPRNIGWVPGSQRISQASCFRLLDSFFHIARTNSRRGSQEGLPDGKDLLLQSDSLFQPEIHFDGRNDLDPLPRLLTAGLYSHCLTALIAASDRRESGDSTTVTSTTDPSGRRRARFSMRISSALMQRLIRRDVAFARSRTGRNGGICVTVAFSKVRKRRDVI